ncbi:MAG: antitoxin family protein [Candidatus Baldrarchaeia archaeon]
MSRVIEAVYENGVLKPMGKLDLREGEVVRVSIERGRGVLTKEDVEEIKRVLSRLPKGRFDLEAAEEAYLEEMLR